MRIFWINIKEITLLFAAIIGILSAIIGLPAGLIWLLDDALNLPIGAVVPIYFVVVVLALASIQTFARNSDG